MGGNGVWSRDVGLEREEAYRKSTEEISEVGDGSGMESAGIHDKERSRERKIESQRAWGFEERLAEGKESEGYAGRR